jgi:hypothetical protein
MQASRKTGADALCIGMIMFIWLEEGGMSYAEPGAGSMESYEPPQTFHVEMTKYLVEALLAQLRSENDKLMSENESLKRTIRKLDELRSTEHCRCKTCEFRRTDGRLQRLLEWEQRRRDYDADEE